VSYHLIINLGTSQERKILLDKPVCRLGRNPEADIVVTDRSVSGFHLSFLLSEDRAEVVDLKSTNGTAVNGKKVDRAILRDGDEVSIAGMKMTFRIIDSANFCKTSVYSLPGQGQDGAVKMLSAALREKAKLSDEEVQSVIADFEFHSRNSRLLEVLCDILKKVLPLRDRDEIIVELLKEIKNLIDLEIAGIYLCDEERFCVLDGGELVSEQSNSIVSREVLKKVFDSRAPVILDNAGDGTGDVSGFASLLRFNIRSLLCFPVLSRTSEIIAVVYCVSKKTDRLKLLGNDRSFLLACSSFIALSLENAELIERARGEAYREASIQGEKRYSPVINRLKLKNENLSLKLGDSFRTSGFYGLDAKSNKDIREFVEKAARTALPVLITGETGVGKSLLAREIHNHSMLSGSFITIDCTTIPPELLESELFGHEKGAFTGAHARKPGKVSLASGGTLFIDEIGELSGSLQAKLLRFIQSGEYEMLGGTGVIHSDARVIAATNRDLKNETAQKRFREDLYFRLNVLQFEIAPLRKRPDLIPSMADHFLSVYGPKLNPGVKGFSRDAADVIKEHRWPGNIRELENAIMRGLVNAAGEFIEVSDLGLEETGSAETGVLDEESDSLDLKQARERIDRLLISKALESTERNVSGAARLLRISRNALMDLIKKYQL
jgi:DNA-binding NtrC family response regulator